jgi:hypothetical protein
MEFYTFHALDRLAQRNLTHDEIDFIVRHGYRLRKAGAVFYQMRTRCMPDHVPPNDPLRRLVGTTVVLSPDEQTLITAYRDEKWFKRDRKKTKYRH